AQQMNRIALPRPFSIFEGLLMHAGDDPESQQQRLDVASQSHRRGGVKGDELVFVGEEAVARPEPAEERLDVGVTEAEDVGRDELRRRLVSEYTEALRPQESAAPTGWSGDCQATLRAVATKPSVAARVDADLVAATPRPDRGAGDGVGESGHSTCEVVNLFGVVC